MTLLTHTSDDTAVEAIYANKTGFQLLCCHRPKHIDYSSLCLILDDELDFVAVANDHIRPVYSRKALFTNYQANQNAASKFAGAVRIYLHLRTFDI